MSIEADDNTLDFIFNEIGEFSLLQIITYALLCIPNAISATYVVGYMFAANPLEYRCKVPECDSVSEHTGQIQYEQPWVNLAIPKQNSTVINCLRYNISSDYVNVPPTDQCKANYFNTSETIKCSDVVYRGDEVNVQNEFGIICEDTYKLALIGTVNNIGRFIFMPLTGLLSDRFGRLTVLVTGMVASSIFGLIKSFSTSYYMYIILEFLESSAGTCTFAACYILGVEWVSSKHRVLGTTVISLAYPVGEIFLGVAAMYIHNFRILLRTLYTPGLFIILYIWLVPESVRWLLVTGKTERAENLLKRVARSNNKELSPKSLEIIRLKYRQKVEEEEATASKLKDEYPSIAQSLRAVVTSRTLLVRLINCCYCWLICAYCYYGLSLSSVQIKGDQNKYVSFITVVAAEIPGILIAYFLLNRVGRRTLLCFSLIVTGLATICSPLVPLEKTSIILMLFIIGKCSVTCAFSVLYIFTAELWPTGLRNTMMNLCSMIGRLGGMLAPLTPLLAYYFVPLPFLLFGGTAIVAGVVVLLCPETLGKKLPDTIAEAKSLI